MKISRSSLFMMLLGSISGLSVSILLGSSSESVLITLGIMTFILAMLDVFFGDNL